jgi:hypothetical protein
MKKTSGALFFILLFVVSAAAFAAVCLSNYTNEKYRYSVTIPGDWRKTETDFGYKHVLYFCSGSSSEIKITSEAAGSSEIDKWNSIEDWYFEDGGLNIRTIHSAGRLIEKEGFSSLVMVFETGISSGSKIKKVSVRKNNDRIIAVECSAPVDRFNKLSETFDQIISSVKFLEK